MTTENTIPTDPAPDGTVLRGTALAEPAAALTTMAVLVAGTVGGFPHTGLFFAPARVVLAVGSVRLRRERS